MIRPSSLPMLAQCPRFTPSGGEFAEAGHERHEALRGLLSDESFLFDSLEEDDAAGVRWAYDYIQVNAPMSEYPLELEQQKEWIDPVTLEIRQGTVDVGCGPHIFDFKWRERDYLSQMAAYALTRPQYPEVTVHILFGEPQVAKKIIFTLETAEWTIAPIIAEALNEDAKATPCDYCDWCMHLKKLTCPAVNETAQAIAQGYSDSDKAKEWHPSKMETPEEIAAALWIARRVLKPWIESIEFHAREAALKKGLALPGFEMKTKKGRSFCFDVSIAFGLSGIPQEKFLQCCDLRLNSSKKIKDKVGLIDVLAEQMDIPKAQAKKQLTSKLAPVLKEGNPITMLVAKGESEEEE